MAKKNKPKQLDNEDDGGQEEEEPDFSDPEDFVDDITDEGEGVEAGEGAVREGRGSGVSTWADLLTAVPRLSLIA